MDSKKYLKTVFNTIEENIHDKINVEELAAECYVSPRQLYRDFYSVSGHSVNEYIRKRRLSKALNLLKHSNMSLPDISYLCGYSSQQAFCKSVKDTLSITPTEYKNNKDIYYFPPCNKQYMKQITVTNIKLPDMICIRYYDSKLIGIENRAIYSILSALPEYNKKILGRNGQQIHSQFCYEVLIEYSESHIHQLKTNGYCIHHIEPEYSAISAQLITSNNEDMINEAWDYLYSIWPKGSMFEPDISPYFEEYIIKASKIKKLILHLPIRQKDNFYRIQLQTLDERLCITSSHSSESSAAHHVMDFISQYHAYLFNTQKEYYYASEYNQHICGMLIHDPIYLSDKNHLKLLSIPSGTYAILESACYGNNIEYQEYILQWLFENGMEPADKPFIIYDCNASTDINQIIVKTQVKVNQTFFKHTLT